MTPMEKAHDAANDAAPEDFYASEAMVEAAITAYLTALSEDEATVEKVARGLNAATETALDTHGRFDTAHMARAALAALASRDERK